MSTYKLANLIRARFPMIYITTFEEDRVTKYITSIVTDENKSHYCRDCKKSSITSCHLFSQ